MSYNKATNTTDRVISIEYSYIEEDNFKPLYSAVENIKFSESGKQTKAGILYEQNLSLFYPSNVETDLPSKVNPYKHKLKLKFLSGAELILGDTVNYFEAICNFEMLAKKTGYNISFARKCLQPAKI